MVKITKDATVTVGVADTTVYSPTSGRAFYLEGVVVSNPTPDALVLNLYDGPSATGVHKLSINVPPATTIAIGQSNGLGSGLKFEFGNVVADGTTGNGLVVTIVGYEQ